MTSKSEIASIMLEAAELLKEDNEEVMNESAGKNGMDRRFYEEKAKISKSKLDSFNKKYQPIREKLDKKIGQYDRAGFDNSKKYKKMSGVRRSIDSRATNMEYDVNTYKTAARLAKENSIKDDPSRIEYAKHDDNIKAVRAYKEYVKASSKGSDRRNQTLDSDMHYRINTRKGSLKEAVDVLYEKASLCESAEDTMYYIDQAIALSEEI